MSFKELKRFLISNFLASTDIKVLVAHTFYIAASDWPRTFFTPGVFLFSISYLQRRLQVVHMELHNIYVRGH